MTSIVKITNAAETLRFPIQGEPTYDALAVFISSSWPTKSAEHAVYKDKAGNAMQLSRESFQSFVQDTEEVPAPGKKLWRLEIRAVVGDAADAVPQASLPLAEEEDHHQSPKAVAPEEAPATNSTPSAVVESDSTAAPEAQEEVRTEQDSEPRAEDLEAAGPPTAEKSEQVSAASAAQAAVDRIKDLFKSEPNTASSLARAPQPYVRKGTRPRPTGDAEEEQMAAEAEAQESLAAPEAQEVQPEQPSEPRTAQDSDAAVPEPAQESTDSPAKAAAAAAAADRNEEVPESQLSPAFSLSPALRRAPQPYVRKGTRPRGATADSDEEQTPPSSGVAEERSSTLPEGEAGNMSNHITSIRNTVRRLADAESWQQTKDELSARFGLDGWTRRSRSQPQGEASVVVAQEPPQVVQDILATFDANKDGFLNYEECVELQRTMFARDLPADTYQAFCCRFGVNESQGLTPEALTHILCGGMPDENGVVEVSNVLRDFESAKEEAVSHLILTFDTNQDGFLNFEDCKEVQSALFGGKLWEETYRDLCKKLQQDAEVGLGPQALARALVAGHAQWLQPGQASMTIFNRDFVRANRQVDSMTSDSMFKGLAEQVLRVPGVLGAAARTFRGQSRS
mmetsp:Transcript_50672/g.120475  ORF Transcript_50672/g.120475 Transcript_50672/m.120475 type:complete len:624 (-) Transcript_50672:112-1983(-)